MHITMVVAQKRRHGVTMVVWPRQKRKAHTCLDVCSDLVYKTIVEVMELKESPLDFLASLLKTCGQGTCRPKPYSQWWEVLKEIHSETDDNMFTSSIRRARANQTSGRVASHVCRLEMS